MSQKKYLSYKDAGVDISKGSLFIKKIKPFIRSTKNSSVLCDVGSFSSLYSIAGEKYKEPVLVSSSDGVGTKLLIAQALGSHKWVGYDLVGMCANDIATTGAKPLFFQDYISTGRLKISVLKDVVKSIASACRESGYALVGGETAEMPGMYKPGEYDLAGFCVGIIEKSKIINGSSIKKGDIIIGLASTGAHSNGYSLIRKVFSKKELFKFKTSILKPTRLYTNPLQELRKKTSIKGIAHITGGSYLEKVPRIIPKGLCAVIDTCSWDVPGIFKKIQQRGNIADTEMYRTFNMGIGMLVVLAEKDVKKATAVFSKHRIKSRVIGGIEKGAKKVRLV